MRRHLHALAAALLLVSAGGGAGWAADALPIDGIRLPAGFRIGVFAADLPSARQMAQGPDGTVFVGSRGDRVYAVRDADGDGRAEDRRVLLRGLARPHGVAVHGDDLYVGELGRVRRYPGLAADSAGTPRPETVVDGLPDSAHHGLKTIAFAPDGALHVAIGSPCNVCSTEGQPYGKIVRYAQVGAPPEVVAMGVRNSVGFDWDPATGELWFTDNGRDLLGDDIPPDELNRVSRPGAHYGFPFCHGRQVADPTFGAGRTCAEFTPPAQELGPHVAALGMAFYTGAQFPPAYRGQIFIAEHGSWNRSRRIGYRVTLVSVEGGRPVSYTPFAEGWLGADDIAWGRPVDVLVARDGALLVSDDSAGAIYRITFSAP